MVTSEDLEFELPNRGDDRPGLDDLDEPDTVSDDLADELADDDDDELDYPDDATDEDVDLIVALYREDGQPMALALGYDLANDLAALITQLRRIPGDGGAVALISIASEVFLIIRVRGKHVQVFCSDAVAANDWPLARDVVDLLGIEVPDEDLAAAATALRALANNRWLALFSRSAVRCADEMPASAPAFAAETAP